MDATTLGDLRSLAEALLIEMEQWLEPSLPMAVQDAAQTVLDLFGNPPDLDHRAVPWGREVLHLIYFDYAVGDVQLLAGVVQPLLLPQGIAEPSAVVSGSIKRMQTITAAGQALLEGQVLVGASSWSDWWAADVANPPLRAISEPKNEEVIHGPHTGFIEDTTVNLWLLRQFVRTPLLRVEQMTVGGLTQTPVTLVWVAGISQQAVIERLKAKISQLDLDGIIDSSELAELLGGSRLLPTFQYSERPDQVASALLEGRVAVFAGSSPTALMEPAGLVHLMASVGDYYQMASLATMTRILRYLALVLAIVLPPLYVALLTVNAELIPMNLALTIGHSRIAIPFPVLVETLLMMAAIDLVQEAGMMMPGAMGQTVTIVGALVVGDAAVKAGIVSAPTVVVVAVAMLAQLMLPDSNLEGMVRLVRYPLVLLGSVFGIVGVTTGIVILIAEAAQTMSLSLPYLEPFAPRGQGLFRDTVLRLPVTYQNRRPSTSHQATKR